MYETVLLVPTSTPSPTKPDVSAFRAERSAGLLLLLLIGFANDL